ncbi:MAG: carboxypeptidase regulatory-like domain-containing protein, partial [Acidobacteriaceae bacterium]
MPSFSRDVFQLAQFAPGVFGDGSQASGGGTNSLPGSNMAGTGAADGIFKTENAPQIVSNGGQNEMNGISIDGISTASAVWGGSSVITPSEESVKAVTVLSNNYDAENGRFGGAQIQVTTQNGTNHLHGSAFLMAERPGLNAYQAWNGPGSTGSGTPAQKGVNKDDQRYNQFGGSAGGPLWKNKLFAFFAYEALRNDSVNTGQAWYETPQYLQMAPSGSIASQILSFPGEGASYSSVVNEGCSNLGLIEGVQCRTIPGAGVNLGSPITTPLGTQDQTWSSFQSPGIGNGLTNVPTMAYVTTVMPATDKETQYNGRVDANVSSKDLVYGTLYWVPASTTYYNGAIRKADYWNHNQVNDAFTGAWNHTFSPNMLNEARVNAAGWRWNEVSSNPQEPWGLPTDSIDNIGNLSGSTTNFGAAGPSIFDQWTYSYKDVLTKVQGTHNLKFGGDVTRLYYLNEVPWSARPSYSFHNFWDMLNDAPYFEGGNFNPLTGSPTMNRQDDRITMYALFAQDDWKVRPNLTINAGLRWQYFGPMSSKENNLGVLLLGTGTDMLTGMSVRQGGNLYNAQKGNFGPELGFAWSPLAAQSRLVVHGGFGINYNQNEIAIQANGNANPAHIIGIGFQDAVLNQPVDQTQILYGMANTPTNFNGFAPNPNAIEPFNSNYIPTTGAPIGVTGFPNNISTIYTYHYSLDTEYDLGNNWVATLGYQGSASHHLIRQYQMNFIAAFHGYPLNPRVNNTDYYANDANADFNSMLADIKHQFSQSFQIEGQYTWAKSMDDGSQPYYEDPYQWYPKESWGRSDYNVQNAFKLFGIYTPVIFHGNGWLEKTAGGWTISGIMNLHTGFPWTPVYNAPGCGIFYCGSGFTTLRPAAYLGGAGHDTSNSAFESGPGPGGKQFNKNYSKGALAYYTIPNTTPGPSFAQAAATGPGPLPQNSYVARNSINGPNYRDVDMTFLKTFGLPNMPVLGNAALFEFRVDTYNLFNTVNLNGGSISTAINTGTTATSNPA